MSEISGGVVPGTSGPAVLLPVVAVSRWRRVLRGREGIAGLVILVFVLGVALLGPLLAPHPLDQPVGAPGAGPGHGALLGTDFLGRDVLSRILHGGLPVLWLSAAMIILTYLVGVSIGAIAGLSRSLVDPMLMRVVDVLLSFPPILLVLLIIAGAGGSSLVLLLTGAAVLFPGVARIVRTATLEISTRGYIEAALTRGERLFAIMWREILPNIAPAVLADVGVRFSGAVIIVASVSFLGLGAPAPAANWGLMIAENRPIITSNLWSVLVPAALLALMTISVNLLGDAYVRSFGRTERLDGRE